MKTLEPIPKERKGISKRLERMHTLADVKIAKKIPPVISNTEKKFFSCRRTVSNVLIIMVMLASTELTLITSRLIGVILNLKVVFYRQKHQLGLKEIHLAAWAYDFT